MAPLDLSTVLQIITSAGVGIVGWIINDTRNQIKEMRAELQTKVEKEDCVHDVETCRALRAETYQRLDAKIGSLEDKFCRHSHTDEGLVLVRKSL